ncbi:MAG: hypothetical protein EPN53_17070 [Acidobacteria bacterium]|nr:MAG: hypothetical protein EPN53_17070 [Acidobacteriota bacterium]
MTDQPAPPPDFDFDEHRTRAVEAYQRVRPLYEDFAEVVRDILQEALRNASIKVASIEARAKTIDSFGAKAAEPTDDDPNQPKYPDPMMQITDLAAARVITFFLATISKVDSIIASQFTIRERTDKSALLLKEEKLGYHSVHYVVELRDNRTELPEYSRYRSLRAEIQLRTVLQHAWAEIEHDIQYKSLETIPVAVRRRFLALAGLLEIADREFQAVQVEDERLRQAARKSVRQGRLQEVEITRDALKAYLDHRLGPDGRITTSAYEFTARMLRHLGFTNFQQIDECLKPYNDDAVSRTLHGSRQGQLTRFEEILMAAMGRNFVDRHMWANTPWWRSWREGRLENMRTKGIKIGSYLPGPRETEAPNGSHESGSAE